MKVVGIDASLTGLAVCVATPAEVLSLVEFTSKPAKSLRGRFDRYATLAHSVVCALEPHVADLDVIGLEGYSFGSKGSGTITLGEFGAMLRRELLHLGTVVEVTPGTLKQFACGKGNAGKIEVVSALTKRYGREFTSDNKADAFAVAQLMLCALGAVETTNDAQRKAVETVRKVRALEAA